VKGCCECEPWGSIKSGEYLVSLRDCQFLQNGYYCVPTAIFTVWNLYPHRTVFCAVRTEFYIYLTLLLVCKRKRVQECCYGLMKVNFQEWR
jgi:hypothetical protein